MFVPSVLTENIMPNYTVARVMDEVSTEALEALIAKAEAVQKDMYTEASYATLEQELENAKTVLADEFAVQDEIDAATKQLDSALQGWKNTGSGTTTRERIGIGRENDSNRSFTKNRRCYSIDVAVDCCGRKCVGKCERLETKRRKIKSREKSF